MWFWIIIGMLILLMLSLFAQALLSGRNTGGDEACNTAEFDLQLYRDQLSGVERDLERGVVSKDEAARIKIEVSRRLLDADKAAQAAATAASTPRAATIAAIVVCTGILIGSIGVYQSIGAAGYPDLPLQLRIDTAEEMRNSRLSQNTLESERPRMVLLQKLRNAMKARPDDLQGQIYLVQEEVSFGNFSAAYKAQERVVELKGDQADKVDLSALSELEALHKAEQNLDNTQALSLLMEKAYAYRNSALAYRAKIKLIELDGTEADAKDFSDLAYLMFLAADGHVSPEAETAVARALKLNPKDGWGIYFSGLIDQQNGRPDNAFYIWRQLLKDSSPTAPWVAPIRNSIEDAAYFAGVDYTLPKLASAPVNAPAPVLAGPDAGAVAAAASMSDEDRKDMIANMVAQLSERLATQGGSAQEWAQLIGALGVLGDTDRARAIWNEAQGVFATDAQALEMVRSAAKQAGVSE